MSWFESSTSFRAGPLSPASPPIESVKAIYQPQQTDQTPQTPTSPPLMSVSAQSYASSIAASQPSSGQATSQSHPMSSPPSSAPMSAQVSQQPILATTNAFLTPASSVSGQVTGTTAADEMETSDELALLHPEQRNLQDHLSANVGSDPMDVDDPEHRRTDHERQDGPPENSGDGNVQRIAEQTITGEDHAQETDKSAGKSLREQNDAGLESLQQDGGSAFFLCKSSHKMSGPHASQDLLSLYGLSPLVASVARTDPITGEKINPLRKSYEGKAKSFGLAGRNKSVKRDETTPGGLRWVVGWPDEEWHNQKVMGKDISIGSSETAEKKLERAMKMEPGPIPNNEYWEEALGHEKPKPASGVVDRASKKATATSINNIRQVNGASSVGTISKVAEAARPRRAGKKRSYDDSSFVGYGEGYVDDEGDVDQSFYSNSEEGGRSSGKKKRKKDHVSSSPPTLAEKSASYGTGVLGSGAR